MENGLAVRSNAVLCSSWSDARRLANDFFAFLANMPETKTAYLTGARCFVAYLQKHKNKKPVREDVLSWMRELAEKRKAATVNLYLAGVRAFFQWLANSGKYHDITIRIPAMRISRVEHRREALSLDDARRLLESCAGTDIVSKRDYAILSLMMACGLRRCEVVRANIDDFRVRQSGRVLMVQGKGHTDKDSFVNVPDEVADALDNYLAMRGESAGDLPLFCGMGNRNRGRLSMRCVSGLVKARLRGIGIDRRTVTGHSLRHTAATFALMQGNSVEDVQGMLRHTNINTTMIYVHGLEREKSNAERSVARMIFGGAE